MSLNSLYATKLFVETNYNRPISVKDLEKVSYYSYRNIQRIFKYSYGETIGAYQQRLKVENAYKLILYTKESMSEIAFEVGFDSIASFSKAFKACFGVSPREARNNKSVLFQQNAITPILSEEVLKPEIIYIPAIKVYYQTAPTSYVNEEIEALWEHFLEHFLENDYPEKSTEFYGVIADDPIITTEIKCRYDACASLQAHNKKLPVKTILGGRYAKFTHKGGYDTIDETYQKLYAGWILTTDLQFGHTPIIEHYIKYATNAAAPENYSTEILIPLKR